jgi:hypothetical protein
MQAARRCHTDRIRRGRYNRRIDIDKAAAMEAEHVNAIGSTLDSLKERTAQLRRYL